MTPTLSTPRILYEHRQTGWPMLGLAFVPALCVAVVVALAPAADRELPPLLLPILGVVTAVALVGFASMSVMVTRDVVIARFGIGLFRKTVAIADVVDAQVARVRWYEGWGIHWTRHGMLYNVAGFDAVAIRLANGRTLRFGSDEAPRLAAAIRRAVDDRRTRSTATR